MTEPCADVIIAGGGPAGMVAGLLFARAGLRTTVIEKHGDFLRDFRGDTVHPSTLRIFAELGLLDRLLERPHDKVREVSVAIGDRRLKVADFSVCDPRWGFIAMMPQWDFLDFVAGEARKYPHFTLAMNTEVTGLTKRGGRVAGITGRQGSTDVAIAGELVIAADGRRSILREAGGLPLRTLGAPIDVFWFRVAKRRGATNETTGVYTGGRLMVLIDRGEYWQCAYVFAKGEADAIRAAGLAAFRDDVRRVAPMLGDSVAAIRDWDEVRLLSVALDRLDCWHRSGLLVIGDAAHAMSPVGGVGINVAVQDAVAAANILAGPLASGANVDSLLHRVRARRMLAVRSTQAFQNAAQTRIIAPLLATQGPIRPPLPLRLLDRFAVLRRLPAAFLGFGIRPEHVRSPDTGQRTS